MRNLFDRLTATRRQHMDARARASYAVDHFGHDAVDHLRSGRDMPDRNVSRKVVRMAIVQARRRLARSITILEV